MKTHCKHGHEMTPENTYTRPQGGCTECVKCRGARHLAWHAANPKQGSVATGSYRRFAPIRDPGARVGFLPNYNFPRIKFCSKGHAIIGDNIAVGGRSIRCRICARLYCRLTKRRTNGNLGERVVRNVLIALQEGKTFHNLAGWRGHKYVGGKIVNTARLNRFCDENPKLGKRIRALADRNRIRAISQPNPVTTIKSSIIRANNGIMEIISAAVPGYLPRDLRDDAIQNIWLAVFEGRLKRNEIAVRAHEFVRAEYKVNHNAWGHRSLDVPIYLDSRTTLLDTLASGSAGLWD